MGFSNLYGAEIITKLMENLKIIDSDEFNRAILVLESR